MAVNPKLPQRSYCLLPRARFQVTQETYHASTMRSPSDRRRESGVVKWRKILQRAEKQMTLQKHKQTSDFDFGYNLVGVP